MNIDQLRAAVKIVNSSEPPGHILDYCGRWYSPYYYLMYVVALAMEPCNAVELGVEKGRGSFSMTLVPGCKVTGIDSLRREELGRLDGTPNFSFILASSLPVPAGVPDVIDILHIDTNHTYDQAIGEFRAYESRLRPGSVVLWDDTHAMEGAVLKAMYDVGHPCFEADELHPVCGYGLMVYEP